MTDKEVIQTHNDIEMMRRPHLWPLGHVLALKHRRDPGEYGLRRLAVLFYHDGEFGLLEDALVYELVYNLKEEDTDRINWADEHILPEINQDWMVD